MKIEQRRDGATERRILIGLITDSSMLGQIVPKWETGLLKSKWSQLIGSWCIQFHRKYGKAPGKEVESLFRSWADGNNDKDTINLVEKFLGGLSSEYEQEGSKNSSYLVDLAAEHFNLVKSNRLSEDVKDAVATGDLDKVFKLINKFNKVELGVGAGIDVLQDEAAIKHVFAEKTDSIIKYPGDLGIFYGDIFGKDCFVSFEGPEKSGKCVEEHMEVLLSDGRVMTIGKLVKTKQQVEIVSINENTQRFETLPISEFWDNGEKECWSLKTKSGRRVVTTSNHQYLTPDGWKQLDKVQVGDFIAVPKRLPFFGDKEMPESELKFLAFMMADGGCTSGQATFTKTDPSLLQHFESTCDELEIPYRRDGITNYLRLAGTIRRKFASGLWKVSSKTKKIPSCVFSCPKQQIALFLRIFFSCDGWISKNSKCIELTLANKKLLRQIGHLLTRFGIVYGFAYKQATCSGRKFDAWRLTITSEEYVNLFLQEINFLSYKRREPNKVVPSKSFLDKFPYQTAEKFYQELKEEAGPQTWGFGSKGGSAGSFYKKFGEYKANSIRTQICLKKPLMRKSFHAGMSDSKTYNKFMNSDILWDEVKEIRSVGKRKTYDLTVPTHHNFVANDCIVHNTWCLLDLAWRGMEQKRKVAFFEVGDMSQNQVMRRFLVRASRRPMKPGKVRYPVSISVEDDETFVEFEDKEFTGTLDMNSAWKACQRVLKKKMKSEESFLKLACYPNSTISVAGIKSVLETWERAGWGPPDALVIDYADILAPLDGKADTRDQINATWKALRAMSQSLHCLVATATQSNAASYGTDILTKSNFSEDKRKRAHVTASIGINQTREERGDDIVRHNLIVSREQEYSEFKCIHVARCLALANPCVKSSF